MPGLIILTHWYCKCPNKSTITNIYTVHFIQYTTKVKREKSFAVFAGFQRIAKVFPMNVQLTLSNGFLYHFPYRRSNYSKTFPHIWMKPNESQKFSLAQPLSFTVYVNKAL